ncbi:uncharacterized protein PV07_11531 [Cladophialophora immunda]|uniref:Uncharacterized protein n=1 Tax=Cladophialophora immunda TaxID=569365 RepID=A0A0D2BW78_9EURO|nr:uncharacterized protein PV07_11531 [Cladophialophora immunda]KIW23323.1 hypothetical protein PV07_11531 [Cladophialophora immunda]
MIPQTQANQTPRKVCWRFINTGRCRYGTQCSFHHVAAGGPSQSLANTAQHPFNRSRRARNEPDDKFGAWKLSVPKGTNSFSSTPLPPLFFQNALTFVGSEVGVMQETVLILAKDGGLQRIKQVVERNMEGMSLETRWKTIKEQAIPLCQVITHPHVLASTLLDIHLGTIYNFIYGVQGQRAVHFFKLLVATLADHKQVDILPSEIEAVVRAFSKIIDCNTHALVNDDLRPLADTLFDTVAQIDEGEAHESRRLVNRINQRLGIGRELTGWKPPKTTAPPRAIFTLQQDLPGNLSKDGPRHDNDCVNAYDIQIMPTFEEINATRPEYLPSMGQQDWHLPGVSGLLDRHFRLLREDTVGQLRDAVRQEVQASYSPKMGGKRQGPRKLTYDNAQVVKLDFSRWQGLLITIGFDQPSHLRQRSVKQRKEWWEFQKRLRMGSLLCLLSNGALIFCSVIERRPTKPSAITDDSSSSGNEQVSNKSEQPLDLFSDPLRAFTTVSLVGDATEDVLGLMKASTSAPARIVEFPGVLLPSFEPTLHALQGMLRNTEIPFSDYLAPEPQADLSMIAPPYYATKPNFEFDLSCVMKDKSPMRIAVNDESNHEAFRENSVLDRAQADALLTSLQRSLALIQGPPGTGKSFTGVALIKVLLAIQARAKLGPILCVCYTNHALDQLLEDLVRQGIDQIVRVGSQSKSEMLQDCNLRILASKIDLTKTEKHEHWVLKSKLDEDERAISKAIKRLSIKGDVAAIRSYLEIYHPTSYLTLFAGGQDDDGFQSVVYNKTSLLNTWRKGDSHQGPVRPLRTLLEESRIHFLNHPERQRLYHHWLAESKKAAQAALLTALAEYKEHKEQFDQVRAGVDLRCLQQAKIIGVTTTGLARISPLLRKLNSKVLVCEEAGEVLEAHILTALLPSLEHAILIGDHLQLPPHIQSYELSRESSSGKRHSLDISLFERLVTPSCSTQTAVPYSTLETQRRMHPSISELIRNTLYPRLCDSSVVETYPPVTGLAKRLFWFDHAHFEDGAVTETDSTTSHSNTFEVQMVTSLVSHLVRQGVYQANDLAVLTPYLGQLQKIRRALQGLFEISLTEGDILELEKDEVGKENAEPGHSAAPTLQKTPLSRALKVSTIDNFQGEEAKVVIISLVRSNDQKKCGFLRTSNRINVLLSRAKHGMYIIGNSRTSGHVQMWASVIDMLQSGDNFGESLQLQCPRHPQATFSVSKPDDFAIFSPEGGCNLPCEMRLSSAQLAVVRPFRAVIPARTLATRARKEKMAKSFKKTIRPAGRLAAVPSNHADTCVENDVTGIALVLRAKLLAKCHVLTRGARSAAMSHVFRVRRSSVLHDVLTVLVPFLVQRHVTGYHVQNAAPTNWLADINALRFVARSVHRRTTVSMDGQMEMSKHYTTDGAEVSIIDSSIPFSKDELKVCSSCRGPLRTISRYGRIVRRGPIDDATKKFITSANQQFLPLYESVHQHQADLAGSFKDVPSLGNKMNTDKLTLSGGRKEQIKLILKLAHGKRYSSIAKTRNRIMKYLQQVGVEEQPFKRVWDMVQFARRQGKTNSDVEFDHTVVQTSQTLQGESLLLRCELVILSDFLATFGSSLQDVNLESNRVDCLKVLAAAREARQPAVEVEAHTFYAQCCLAERTYSSRSDILMALSKEATEHIDAAKEVCDLHPEPTRHVVGEVKTVEGMLESSTFTTVVNDAEWRLVINAMASGFRGSGHWYTCANNHPFTVGECGMPMQRARCPQCGAPVGGQDHTPAEGVRRATDLENRFSDLRL